MIFFKETSVYEIKSCIILKENEKCAFFILQKNKYYARNFAFKMLCSYPRWWLQALALFHRCAWIVLRLHLAFLCSWQKSQGINWEGLKNTYRVIYFRTKTKWVNKLHHLHGSVSFIQHGTSLWVCYFFFQMKVGQLLYFYFYFCLQAFIWANIPITLVWGRGSRWDVDNRGEMTVLEVFDMQQTLPSPQMGAAEKQLHIKYMFSL